MTPHDEAGHVAALLRQLPPDSPMLLSLVTRLRDRAIAILQPLAPDVDLTDYDAAVLLRLLTLGESGESGESQGLARLSKRRKRGEGEANFRQRAAVDLLRACAEALHRGRVEPWLRDWILHSLAGMDALGTWQRENRQKGGRAARASVAVGISEQIDKLAKSLLATGTERHNLASKIAPRVERSAKTVRDYLIKLGHLKQRKKRTHA